MITLQYRVWLDGNLWHWEVLTEQGVRLSHGATNAKARATADAMSAGMHPENHVEIDTIELSRSAKRAEIALRALADAEAERLRLERLRPHLEGLHIRSVNMAQQSRTAVSSSWRLLRELDLIDPHVPAGADRHRHREADQQVLGIGLGALGKPAPIAPARCYVDRKLSPDVSKVSKYRPLSRIDARFNRAIALRSLL
jgi:hypothetical protein